MGQIPHGPDLVGSHQATISLDVSRENRDQPALCINYFRQNAPLNPLRAYRGTGGEDTSKIEVYAKVLREASMSRLRTCCAALVDAMCHQLTCASAPDGVHRRPPRSECNGWIMRVSSLTEPEERL